MRAILSGGGTAGHIYPALAVAELLAADGHSEVGFVGTPDGVEARLVAEAGVRFFGIPARGFDRARPLTLVTASMILAISTIRALRLMRRFAPDVVVGFGGYVSIPVGLAAVLSRRPLVLHEQNSVPGLANKVLSRWADAVGVTYAGSVSYLRHLERAVVTGNPVRPAVLAGDRHAGRRALGVSPEATMLLAFGGSRGARHINEAMIRGSQALLAGDTIEVVHIAGRAEVESARTQLAGCGVDQKRYRVFEYISDMGAALAAADLVLSRAGATSIAELTALGLPAVLVPYPYATDDHQTKNAEAVGKAGAGVVIRDADLDSPGFTDILMSLLNDGEKRATMAAASRELGRPDAAERMVEIVREAASRQVTNELKEANS